VPPVFVLVLLVFPVAVFPVAAAGDVATAPPVAPPDTDPFTEPPPGLPVGTPDVLLFASAPVEPGTGGLGEELGLTLPDPPAVAGLAAVSSDLALGAFCDRNSEARRCSEETASGACSVIWVTTNTSSKRFRLAAGLILTDRKGPPPSLSLPTLVTVPTGRPLG